MSALSGREKYLVVVQSWVVRGIFGLKVPVYDWIIHDSCDFMEVAQDLIFISYYFWPKFDGFVQIRCYMLPLLEHFTNRV